MKRTLLMSLMLTGTLALTLSAQVNQREANQQGRVAQGEESGELTHHEAKKIEHKEKHVKHEVRRDRRQNGGYLTPQEKAKVNRQENRTSRDIAKDKHNDQVQ